MKELTYGLAKLVAIIVIMAALAVWTTALSLWAGADTPTQSSQPSVTSAQTVDIARVGG